MPISDCEVRDPRIRRTRQALQAALQELMLRKTFDEVSVQDIAEAASVNRATFYDHYTDKFALLDALVGGGFHRMLAERKVRFDGTCASAAGAVILATCDYLTEQHGTGQCQRQSAFRPLMDAAIVRAIGRVLAEGVPKEDAGNGLTAGMVTATASSAIYGAVGEWLQTPERIPAEEMVGMVLKLVLPILQAGGVPAAHAV